MAKDEISNFNALSSIKTVIIFVVISVALLYIGLQPIKEAMVPLECLHSLVFMVMYLSTNSIFLLVLCNVLIGAVLVLSKSSESHDFYRAYLKESEARRRQAIAEASSWIDEQSHSIHENEDDGVHISEPTKQITVKGNPENVSGDCCNENCGKKSMTLAVVPHMSDEELKRKCDEFIVNFRRQMSVQSRHSS